GFSRYELVYDPNERIDDTHDGYHVAGVNGYQEKPDDAVHLEVDRDVSTVRRLSSDASGATTHETTASNVNGTPTIHEQINVRYASDAGPKTKTFTRNNEWTHSNDLVRAANNYRSQVASWASQMRMSPSAVMGLLQHGAFRGLGESVTHFNNRAFNESKSRWDQRYTNFEKSWIAPNGERVWPHTPIDPESGDPLTYNQ